MLASNILRNIIYTGIILFTDLIKEDIECCIKILLTILIVTILIKYWIFYNKSFKQIDTNRKYGDDLVNKLELICSSIRIKNKEKEDTISKDISNIFFNLHIITTIIAVIITVVYVWIYN